MVRRARVRMSVPSQDRPDPVEDSPDSNFSMEILRRRIADLESEKSEKPTFEISQQIVEEFDDENVSMTQADMHELTTLLDRVRFLWVIAFSSSVDDTEGVYSLSIKGKNILLAFEEELDAKRYAMCLQLQDFPSPSLTKLPTNEIVEFCEEAGVKLGFVPSGAAMAPPEESVVEDMGKWKNDKEEEGTLSDEDLRIMRKKFEDLIDQ